MTPPPLGTKNLNCEVCNESVPASDNKVALSEAKNSSPWTHVLECVFNCRGALALIYTCFGFSEGVKVEEEDLCHLKGYANLQDSQKDYVSKEFTGKKDELEREKERKALEEKEAQEEATKRLEHDKALRESAKKYKKNVRNNFYRLPVLGYETLSELTLIPVDVIELFVQDYFDNEQNNRSKELEEILKEHTDEKESKKHYYNDIRVFESRVRTSLLVMDLVQEGNALDKIAHKLNYDVETVKRFVKLFYGWKDIVQKRDCQTWRWTRYKRRNRSWAFISGLTVARRRRLRDIGNKLA